MIVTSERRPENGIGANCSALIDLGDGPRTVLITTAEVVDDNVVLAASPLGRALFGARAGDRVRFRAATGPRMARVLAVEASGPTSR